MTKTVTMGMPLTAIQEKQHAFLDKMEMRDQLGDSREYILICRSCKTEERYCAASQCAFDLRNYHAQHDTWVEYHH